MILIVKDRMRLCQDSKWRGHANFGNMPSCVKVYKILTAAQRKAKKVGGDVVVIPPGVEVDAAGTVIDTTGTRSLVGFRLELNNERE